MKYVYVLLGVSLLMAGDKPVPQVTTDEKTGQPMLLGSLTSVDLKREPFNTWYDSEYEGYEVDEAALDPVSEAVNEVSVQIFMGTWCGDSRREVPRVYKMLDYLGYSDEDILMIAVDRDRVSPGAEEEGMNIHHVPTIIFTKEDQELGRIIEFPVETLEEDMISILLGLPYTPNYEDKELDPRGEE